MKENNLLFLWSDLIESDLYYWFFKKSLRHFIELLKVSNVTNLVDIRLNNTSQLAGYAKKDDLEYILELVGIEYKHDPSLAPERIYWILIRKRE